MSDREYEQRDGKQATQHHYDNGKPEFFHRGVSIPPWRRTYPLGRGLTSPVGDEVVAWCHQ